MNSTFIFSAASDGAENSTSAASASKRDMMAPCEGGTHAHTLRRVGAERLLHGNNPHVAIHDRVAVILELERPGGRFFLLPAGTLLRELDVVVNLHAVVIDRRAAVLRLLAIGK